MVREIVHDPVFLSYKSTAATEADIPIAEDLIDTLRANLVISSVDMDTAGLV